MEKKSGKEQDKQYRQELFINLYKNAFPDFARFVSKMGGTLDEAKDVFQDSLIVWYEKSASSDIRINNSEKAYVLGIARHLWLKHFKNSSNTVSLDSAPTVLNEADETQMSLKSQDKLLHFLETAGQKCMDLLKAFYYDKLSPSKLADQFGFSGERSATVQKFKCLEKVRNEVKQRSLSYADFID